MSQGMHEQWKELWAKAGGRGKGIVQYTDLISRYSEPWRVYHNFNHIQAMLDELDTMLSEAGPLPLWFAGIEPMEIQMAIWYHQIFFHAQVGDNWEKSAQLFEAMAKKNRLRKFFIERVMAMIMATAHIDPPTDLSTQVLCDLDLAILGVSASDYDVYERQLYAECGGSAVEFGGGRIETADILLARPAIYSTDYFREKYEGQARKNLKHTIERWKAVLRSMGDHGLPVPPPHSGEDPGKTLIT